MLALVLAVTLTWTLNPVNPAPPVTHTRVYRAQAPCPTIHKYTLVAEGINTNSWQDTTVKAGASYCYFVTTRNPATGLESGASDVVKITVP